MTPALQGVLPAATDALAPQSSPAQLSGARNSNSADADQQKLKKAAGDFESILLASLWKGMKGGFGNDEINADPAHGTLEDWGIEIMASAVGRPGGLRAALALCRKGGLQAMASQEDPLKKRREARNHVEENFGLRARPRPPGAQRNGRWRPTRSRRCWPE